MKTHKKIIDIPEPDKIVSTITLAAHYRWDYKFPFRHYVKPRYLVATENAVYEIRIDTSHI